MVYSDNYMTVLISDIAEIGNNGIDSLFITHLSGQRNQTIYGSADELQGAYQMISGMVVQLHTGKTPAEHVAAEASGISLVESLD